MGLCASSVVVGFYAGVVLKHRYRPLILSQGGPEGLGYRVY